MKYAVSENGLVVNIIEATPEVIKGFVGTFLPVLNPCDYCIGDTLNADNTVKQRTFVEHSPKKLPTLTSEMPSLQEKVDALLAQARGDTTKLVALFAKIDAITAKYA